MQRYKRFIIATGSGILFGFVCLAIAASAPGKIPLAAAFQIILSRALIGFTIGISCFSFGHWSLHGLIIGLVMSLPLAFSGLMAPESPEFSKINMFAWTVILGMIYGFLTELITSVLFKAKMQR